MKTTTIKILSILGIAFLATLNSIAQHNTVKGVEPDENTVITVSVTKKTNGIDKVIEKTFSGKCTDAVNVFLKETGSGVLFSTTSKEEFAKRLSDSQKMMKGKHEQKKIMEEEIELNDDKTIEEKNIEKAVGGDASFDEKTKSFYGENYDQLDKIIIEIHQFEKNKDGEKQEVFSNKIIKVDAQINLGNSRTNTSIDSSVSIKSTEEVKIKKVRIEKVGDDAKKTAPTGNNTSEIGIFPNPGKGIVNITFAIAEPQNLQIVVTDITGKEVYTQSLNGFSGHYNNSIDLSKNGKGTYLLNINGQKTSFATKKIVLQ